MAKRIDGPSVIEAAGHPPKRIEEYIGRVNSDAQQLSIARMVSPAGWTEPGQTPEFDEYSVVLSGCLHVETREETFEISAGQAVVAYRNEWVRYSTPQGAEYISVCMPAFSPDTVHRDDTVGGLE